MKVDYAFVAEAADSQGGLFYVTRGGADIYLLPREFPKPLRLGAISFVLRVVGDPEDIGQSRTFVCSIVDANDQPVNFHQEVNATFEAHPIDPDRANGSVLAFQCARLEHLDATFFADVEQHVTAFRLRRTSSGSPGGSSNRLQRHSIASGDHAGIRADSMSDWSRSASRT